MSSGKVSHANKQKMLEYMKTDRQDAFNDKMRLLIICVLCGNDLAEIRSLIDVMKLLHGDQFDEPFIQSLLRKRPDFDQANTSPQ